MEIKHLAQVMDLCRKKGVQSIEIEGIKINFGTPPPKRVYTKKNDTALETQSFPTPEQLLNWSVNV